MNMVRSMFKDKHLPKEYCGEVVECSGYMLNISPTKRLTNLFLGKIGVERVVACHILEFLGVLYMHMYPKIEERIWMIVARSASSVQ